METIRTAYWIYVTRTAIVSAIIGKITGSMYGSLDKYWIVS